MKTFKEVIKESFAELKDYRRAEGKRHPLINLIMIAVCAVIANAECEKDIWEYGKAKKKWLQTILNLKSGIPSESTFKRFFSLIDAKQFEKCFIEFTKSLPITKSGDHIAIDGKTLRSSYDQAKKQSTIHILSAFVTKSGITLAQVKTDDKSNEITVIPELIDMINIENTVLSMDAMGTQKSIAEKIIDKKGDYVLALKSNHPTFYHEVEDFFQQCIKSNFQNTECKNKKTADKGHGRIEEREYMVCSVDYQCISEKNKWKGIQSIICTTTKRHEILENKTSIETRFFISSLKMDNVERIATAIRSHWGIENSLHYVLDVTFGEDASRIRTENAAENFSVLRRIALNVLRCDKSSGSIRSKRLRSCWNNDFMEELLANFKKRMN